MEVRRLLRLEDMYASSPGYLYIPVDLIQGHKVSGLALDSTSTSVTLKASKLIDEDLASIISSYSADGYPILYVRVSATATDASLSVSASSAGQEVGSATIDLSSASDATLQLDASKFSAGEFSVTVSVSTASATSGSTFDIVECMLIIKLKRAVQP